MKQVRYLLEAVVLFLFYGFCALLPPATASNLGGWIGRNLGPRMAVSRKALANVALAFPEKSETERKKIITEMWDNLGRVMAEYPHLERIAKTVTVTNKNIVDDAVSKDEGGIFFGAHQGNWEVNCPTMLVQFGVAPSLTYRAPNNPLSEWLLEKARTMGGRLKAIPKARSSAKDLMNTLKSKNYIGILLDQKYNEGIAADFFGHPAMTNPVAVMLCQKYEAPLIPVQNKRTGPAQFELTIHPPVALFNDDGSPLPQERVVANTNKILEDWIREEPGQWLWLHRRWNSAGLS
jgi:KDO2-lipid IV(A) lauroyltransferase